MKRLAPATLLVLLLASSTLATPLLFTQEASADAWRRDAAAGFAGSYNQSQYGATCSAVLNGHLYVGTSGGMFGNACQVWRYNGSSWRQASRNSFGDDDNRGIESMAVFGGYLYVGTYSSSGCQVWRTAGTGGPPCRWTKVSSPSDIGSTSNYSASAMAATPTRLYVATGQTGGLGCEVWRYDGAAWTISVGPGCPRTRGFGDANNSDATAMAVSPSGEVYAGTRKQGGAGCDVWRGSGTTWTRANTDGFEDANNREVTSLCFNGAVPFAGTKNDASGAAVFQYNGTPGTAWTKMNANGFGNANNLEASAALVFGARLHVSTHNDVNGTRVYRYESPGNWTAVSPAGFGQSPDVYDSRTLCSFGGSLFAGTYGSYGCGVMKASGYTSTPYAWARTSKLGFTSNANSRALCSAVFNGELYVGTESTLGCEVWKKAPSGWARVAGEGFGDRHNSGASCMASVGGYLYVGTNSHGGCQVWRYDGSTWKRVNTDGFGRPGTDDALSMVGFNGKLYVGTLDYHIPYGRLMRFDGPGAGNWTQVNKNGFGSSKHVGVMSLAVMGGRLYAGTSSSNDPCAVFRWDGSSTSDWKRINNLGFGRPNTTDALHLTAYRGKLYCAAFNRTMHGAEVWRYSGSGNSWSQVNTNGFGAAGNTHPGGMAVFSGLLYVGTGNYKAGGQVWSYDGSKWNRAAAGGFSGADNGRVETLCEFEGRLYAGTDNPIAGCEVWSTPGLSSSWYLAEGTTAWGFSTYVTIENPNASAVDADITYMTSDGPVSGGKVRLPARSQVTVNPEEKVGTRDFSTLVTSAGFKRLAVDRTMSWNAGGGEEGHTSVGVTSPSCTWYLPEGSSAWGFECWLLLQNPGSTDAACTVTYMIEGAPPVTASKTIPAGSRQSFNMADDIGSADASVKVTSDQPVIPERAMYRNDRRGGHDSIGTTAAAKNYYLAEGTTAWGFTTYVLIQNPNDKAAKVTVTYMTPGGPREQPPFEMPPSSRKTVRVNDALPETDFSTRVSSDVPVIAERSMYWDNGTGEACHDSIGLAAPHAAFYLPDGQTSEGRETWTLVQNPGGADVQVEISYLTPTGSGNVVFSDTVPGNSRRTYNMAERLGDSRAAVLVRSKDPSKKIMVERAMYWSDRGAGTGTIGGFSD